MKLMHLARTLFAVLAIGTFVAGCDDKPDPNKAAQQQTQTTSASSQQASTNKATTQPGKSVTQPAIQGEAATTRNFYVVFDGSGSMADCPPATSGKRNCKPKIVGAKEALVNMAQGLPGDTNLGLFVFDDYGYREVVPLGPKNKAAFIAGVNAVRANNGTPLGEAIQQGVKVLQTQYQKQLGYGEFRLVIVTDGESNGNVPLSRAVGDAKKATIPLYTIGFGIAGDHELRKYSVHYWAADSETEVGKALQEAVTEIDFADTQ
jgi:Ca-activated chloride channel family protein